MILLIFFIFGLIIGSFLNVVIARMATLETILGRSFCRHCRKQIRWYDNVPLLSFVVLRGRCRDCKEKISWQYPAVELGTALLFALAGMVFFDIADMESWVRTIFVLGTISFGMVLFVYDLKHMEIPMVALWLGIVWAIGFLLLFDAYTVGTAPRLSGVLQMHLHSGVVAGFAAFAFFFFLAAVSKERWMGLGDAYVALWMGLTLGSSWIFPSLVLAFTVGAITGVALMVFSRRYSMKSRVPFAPFLVGSCVVMLFAQACMQQTHFLFRFL